jgi:hypothetical protein
MKPQTSALYRDVDMKNKLFVGQLKAERMGTKPCNFICPCKPYSKEGLCDFPHLNKNIKRGA